MPNVRCTFERLEHVGRVGQARTDEEDGACRPGGTMDDAHDAQEIEPGALLDFVERDRQEPAVLVETVVEVQENVFDRVARLGVGIVSPFDRDGSGIMRKLVRYAWQCAGEAFE